MAYITHEHQAASRQGKAIAVGIDPGDGRTIRLGEMAGSDPRTWADVGLRFVIDGDFVELSQSNGERNLPCEPAGAPDPAS